MENGGFKRRDFLKGVASAAMAAGFIGVREAAAYRAPSGLPNIPRGLPTALMPHPNITAAPRSEGFWRQVRMAFPLPENYYHLNTGTTGSQPVFSLVNLGVYNLYKSLDPRDWEKIVANDFPELFPAVPSARGARQAAVAAAYGANTDEIVLDYNTTDACNMIFAGIPWQPGDRIVTTTFEHPALAGPTAWARDYHGVEVAVVEMPSVFETSRSVPEVLSWFETELARPLGAGKRQYVAFSEIFYKNGLRMPVKEICALARNYGAYSIVDSAHGWGQLPIDCHDYGADFIAGAGHKWLCGGPGTGILYVRNSGTDLPPLAMGNFVSYGNLFQAPSVNYASRSWLPGTAMQSRGELNTPALYAMTDVLSFFDYIGLRNIYDRGVLLGNYLKGKIEERWGQEALWVQKNPDPAFATCLTSFNPFRGKDDSSQFATLKTAIGTTLDGLAAETPKIYIRSVTWRNRKTDSADNRIGFRVSTHAVYNDFEQVDYLFERLVHHVDNSGLPQL